MKKIEQNKKDNIMPTKEDFKKVLNDFIESEINKENNIGDIKNGRKRKQQKI